MRSNALRFCVVGAGPWARVWVQNLKESYSCNKDEFLIFATSERRDKELGVIRKFSDIDSYTNRFDVAIVAVPIGSLKNVAKEVVRKNKGVVVEKPGASNVAEISDLRETAVRRDIDICCFYPAFFDEGVRLAKKGVSDLVQDRSFDTCVQVKYVWKKWGTFHSGIVDNLVSHKIAEVVELFEVESIEGFEFRKVAVEENVASLSLQLKAFGGRVFVDVDIDITREDGNRRQEMVLSSERGKVARDYYANEVFFDVGGVKAATRLSTNPMQEAIRRYGQRDFDDNFRKTILVREILDNILRLA